MHSPIRNTDETLSREISYALRHAPEKYGLVLDEWGWASVDALLSALQRQAKYAELTEADLEGMISRAEKKRHELASGRIRALYGHSVAAKIEKERERPPAVLYHGTARRFLPAIREQGLKPMKRQYVHLAEDPAVAVDVGGRRDDKPVLLCIDATAAWERGIGFYRGGQQIWLADAIPPDCILESVDTKE